MSSIVRIQDLRSRRSRAKTNMISSVTGSYLVELQLIRPHTRTDVKASELYGGRVWFCFSLYRRALKKMIEMFSLLE